MTLQFDPRGSSQLIVARLVLPVSFFEASLIPNEKVEDVRLAVSHIRRVLSAAASGDGLCSIAAVGWSCGGSIVSNYAAVQVFFELKFPIE